MIKINKKQENRKFLTESDNEELTIATKYLKPHIDFSFCEVLCVLSIHTIEFFSTNTPHWQYWHQMLSHVKTKNSSNKMLPSEYQTPGPLIPSPTLSFLD